MTISQMPLVPDIASDNAISHHRLAYLQERTRNQLFEFVMAKFIEAEAGGLTKAKLARRIHRSPEVITRLLGSPGNWTISTISDLLVGIADEELAPNSDKIMGRSRRNHIKPDWLSDGKPSGLHVASSITKITDSAPASFAFRGEVTTTTAA